MVQADDNLLEIVDTSVQDKSLVIQTRESYRSKSGVKVTVTTQALDAVDFSGAGDVTVIGLADQKVTIALRGAGSITANGKVDAVTASGTALAAG